MLWHIVKLRFAPSTTPEERAALERSARELADAIGEIRLLRVAASVDEPDVLGLLTAFDDAAALEAYRHHPAHVPVVARLKELCDEIVRLDVVTGDEPGALPRTEAAGAP